MGYDGRMGKRRNNKAAGARGGYGSLRDMLREDEKARGGGASGTGGAGARDASRKKGRRAGGTAGRARAGSASDASANVPAPLTGDAHARIAIIGGGAAGLAAAVAAARELGERGLHEAAGVVVFETDERVGRSILATGNGRCNFSNSSVDASLYRNPDFVEGALRALADDGAARLKARGLACDPDEDPVLRFFEDIGLVWREEAEGRLYPATGKASTVVDVLRAAASDAGAVEARGRRVIAVEPPAEEGGLFHLRFADGSIEHAAAVIMAVGGKHALCGSDGGDRAGAHAASLLPERYAVEPPRPVLGPLRVREEAPRRLDNIRVRARVRLADDAPFGATKAEERGEVLFRSYGVSGICVFNLSRFAEPGDALLIDFLPQVERTRLRRYLVDRARRLATPKGSGGGMRAPITYEALLRGLLLPQIGHSVLEQAGLDPHALLDADDLPALERALSEFPLTVEGIGDERQCQVLRGGLAIGAFDPRTMESRLDAGLFAAGEALDVDAPCGGYNLHWAWASGLLAGATAARRIAANVREGEAFAAQGGEGAADDMEGDDPDA